MLENLDKIMHLRFNFDAYPMHSPFGFVHLTHQNLSARALFCLNSLAKVNTQLLIYNSTSPLNQLITEATCINEDTESLLDHVYVSHVNKVVNSGVIHTGLSDHFLVYVTVENVRSIRKVTNTKLIVSISILMTSSLYPILVMLIGLQLHHAMM